MLKLLRKAWEWVSHLDTLSSLLHTEFVRTAILPTVYGAMTGALGVFGGVPAMWIAVAIALTLAATMTFLTKWEEYKDQKTPLNKLQVLGVQFTCNLNEATLDPPPLPKSKRIQQNPIRLGPTAINPEVKRVIEQGQLHVVLQNTAKFPISCYMQEADTEINGLKPPRSSFPKDAATFSPGVTFAVFDEVIQMGGIKCGRMTGRLKMKLRYGLPGKEKYLLDLRASVNISMEDFGFINPVSVSWET